MKHNEPAQHQTMCETNTSSPCSGRREFLVRTVATAGGLVLAVAGVAATGGTAQADAIKPGELLVNLGEHAALKEIGGFDTFETDAGKIVVAQTAAGVFTAVSAVCPHRGAAIKYDKDTTQFFCPLHNSRFSLDGKVTKGPAKTDLTSLPSQTAAIVTLKIGA